jgi:hypothetical protein
MTLTVRLDPDDESRLQQIADLLHSGNQSDAIRSMINEAWTGLQLNLTFVERRGGHPKVLLEGSPTLSERKNRKAEVAKYFEEKDLRRKQKSIETSTQSAKTRSKRRARES